MNRGILIKNWTAANGYLGDEFSIVFISNKSILVSTPSAKFDQNVPREDLRKVWEIWPKYKSGEIQRQALTPLTRYSKYVISIFRWLENQ